MSDLRCILCNGRVDGDEGVVEQCTCVRSRVSKEEESAWMFPGSNHTIGYVLHTFDKDALRRLHADLLRVAAVVEREINR